jgi:transposase
MTQNVTISPRKRRAIEALITAKDTSAAAEAAGVSRRTLYRWMDEPAFKAGLNSAEAELEASARRELLSRQKKAIEIIEAVMLSNRPVEALRAAQTILDYSLRYKDLDVERRLAELESEINERKD